MFVSVIVVDDVHSAHHGRLSNSSWGGVAASGGAKCLRSGPHPFVLMNGRQHFVVMEVRELTSHSDTLRGWTLLTLSDDSRTLSARL
jgi:hypothetical protein